MQPDQIAEAAKSNLAQDLGIPAQDIHIDLVDPVDWPDPSLGLPAPGMMYAQVITPGYRIVLKHGTETYEYRSNESGSILRFSPAS
jgi:hypothetical protein